MRACVRACVRARVRGGVWGCMFMLSPNVAVTFVVQILEHRSAIGHFGEPQCAT